MATIWKRNTKEPSYLAIVRMKGHSIRRKTFKRKTDAKAWAKAVESDLDRGRDVPTNEAQRRTLRELVERYLEEDGANPPKSLKRKSQHLGWWKEQIGDLRLVEVTPDVLKRSRKRLLGGETYRGTRRSPATANRYTATLRAVFNWAVRETDWAVANPVSRLKPLPESRGRVRFLSDDEREHLLKACRKSKDARLYPLVSLALSTGARAGELMALQWPDVDWERSRATLHETKNRERRAIFLSPTAVDVLREHSRVRRIDSEHVFAGVKGAPHFPQKAWEAALKAAKIEDFRFHDLRHSAASYLAMSGATLSEIAEILGHKTLAMVKRYSHLTEAHSAKVVERMNERFLAG